MADQYLQRLGVPPQFLNLGTPAAGAFSVDANNDGIGAVLSSPTTDAITHIGFRYGVRTGTPPTYAIGFEGLSSGNPDGTFLGGGSPRRGLFTPPADTSWDNLWQWVALENSHTPSVLGEYLCVALRYSSGTINASNFSSFANELSAAVANGATHYPYSLRLTAGTWAKRQNMPLIGIRTANARYGYYWSGHYTTTLSTSGHRSAMHFRLESGTTDTFKIAGFKAWCTIGTATGQSPKAGLWSSSAELASVTLSTTNDNGPNTRALREFYFSSQPTLNAGTDYYIGLEAVGSALGVAGFQLADAGDRVAFPGGLNWHLSTWNGSAWTDDTTVRPQVELIPADMTQASGGSGSILLPGGFGQIGVAVH